MLLLHGLDLPGHHRSALPAGRLTVERMAADVERLLVELGEPPVHVAGLSLGACVGLALAFQAPARVRSLTLVNGFARFRPAGAPSRGVSREGARLVVVPDSGHATPGDQPARFNRIVLEFIGAH